MDELSGQAYEADPHGSHKRVSIFVVRKKGEMEVGWRAEGGCLKLIVPG